MRIMKNKKDIMKFAGIWKDMTDEEAEKLKKYLRKGWKKFKTNNIKHFSRINGLRIFE